MPTASPLEEAALASCCDQPFSLSTGAGSLGSTGQRPGRVQGACRVRAGRGL